MNYVPLIWQYLFKPQIVTSGTRRGMKLRQWITMNWLLHMLDPELVHNGNCKGADTEVNWMVRTYLERCGIRTHPCKLPEYWADSQGEFIHPSSPKSDHCHHMVDLTDITIATPFEDEPVLHSGTWSTIRYSMSLNRPTIIIKRDGGISVFDGRKVVPMKTNVISLGSIDADGVTAGIPIDESRNGYVGVYVASTGGTFGTLKLQSSPTDSGTTDYTDVPSASWTSAGYKHLQVYARRLRLSLSGATTPGITAKLAGASSGVTVVNS